MTKGSCASVRKQSSGLCKEAVSAAGRLREPRGPRVCEASSHASKLVRSLTIASNGNATKLHQQVNR